MGKSSRESRSDDRLRSWTCKGCINTVLRITADGDTAVYCKYYKSAKRPRIKWVTDNFVDCLDKRTEEQIEQEVK